MTIELYPTTSDLKTRFGYSRRAIQTWIQAYNRNRLEGLRDTPGRGTRCKLNPD
jgi:transposase